MEADRIEELRIHAQDSFGMIGPDCPYWLRYFNVEGHDPEGTCGGGCLDEPACITGSWPAERDDDQVVWGYVLELLDEHDESLPGLPCGDGLYRCIIPSPADAWTDRPGWVSVMDHEGTTHWRNPDEIRAQITELRDMDEHSVAADMEQLLDLALRRYPFPNPESQP